MVIIIIDKNSKCVNGCKWCLGPPKQWRKHYYCVECRTCAKYKGPSTIQYHWKRALNHKEEYLEIEFSKSEKRFL